MLEISAAEYLDEYRIRLCFNTGETKIVDLSEHLWGRVFDHLKDKEKFKKFRVDWGTIVWENDADFAPEFLYEIASTEESKKASSDR